MRIRSRIIYEDPEKYYYFISNNKFGILEDPEPNYYFVNNNIYFNNVRVRVLSERKMRIIIRIIIV